MITIFIFSVILTLDLCRASLKTTLCDVGSLSKDLIYYYYYYIFLLDNGKVASNPCATLNESFVNPRIPESVLNLSEEDLIDHLSIATIKSELNLLNFSFTEINLETTTAYLSKIEVKKSTGHDGPPKILKLSTPSLADPLTTLFNYCIRTSTLPSSWKMSNLSPIYKKGDTSDKNNY